MKDPQNLFSLVFGALTVIVFAYARFSDPPKCRSTTTAFRFHAAAVVYSLGMLIGYSLLVALHWLGPMLIAILPKAAWESFWDPLVGALLITGLLPHTPGLSSADAWVRARLKRMAAIPTEVRRLAAQLESSSMALPPELAAKVRSELLRQGIDEAEVLIHAKEGPARHWVAMNGLLLHLDAWRTDPAFSEFLAKNWEEFAALRSRRDQLVPAARHLLATAADSDRDSELLLMAREYRKLIREQFEELHLRTCELISRAILECCFTHASRVQQLGRLGFRTGSIPSGGPVVDVNLLVALFLLVAVVYTFIRTAWAVFEGKNAGQVLALGLFIATVYAGSICSAVYPHAWWRKRRSTAEPPPIRPWALYLVCGLLAATVALSIGFSLKWIEHGRFVEAVAEQQKSLPWLLMAFGTAFALAFQLDNEVPKRLGPRRWRIVEAAIQAAVTLTCAALVLASRETWEPGQELRIVLVALSVGSLIGYLVPTWIRRARSEESADVSRSATRTTVSVASSAG